MKTSTGFNAQGATISDVQLMRAVGRAEITGSKHAGGIRDARTALAMIRSKRQPVGYPRTALALSSKSLPPGRQTHINTP